MYTYTTTNPCICPCPPSGECQPKCPEDCNCLKACNISIKSTSDLAVGPCAQVGQVDVMNEEFNHNFCACKENPVRWSVVDFDPEIFITSSITKEGILSWTTQGPESLDKQYGCITLKACCGELSTYVTVIIGVKDLCTCPDCDQCEDCDPCTGECIELNVEVSVDDINSQSNVSINAS